MRLLGLTLGLALVLVHAARADFVTMPNPGLGPNGGSPGPFLITRDVFSSIRYQQVYRGTAFGVVTTQPVSITELSFSARQTSIPIDVNLQNIAIRLSTTSRTPDGLSNTFADNVGANEAVVYSGALHFFDTGTETYGIHISLQKPFIYDYHSGNLLMDVFNFSTIAAPSSGMYLLNAEASLRDSVSEVAAGSVSVLSGISDTAGLSTRFTVTPVPEPGTNVLLLVGAACAALGWKRRAFHG